MNRTRCPWAGDIPIYQAYHDQEWGVPVHDDRTLFEFLILEGAQAGLSWITILKKRAAYRVAFDNFDVGRVARYDANKIESLLQIAAIVRNRLKVTAAVNNAQKFIAVQEEFGSFDAFIWRFVGGVPTRNNWNLQSDVPAKTTASDEMSQALKRRGFKFVGSTICYAYMQATGMVNDHVAGCYRHSELSKCD